MGQQQRSYRSKDAGNQQLSDKGVAGLEHQGRKKNFLPLWKRDFVSLNYAD